MILKKYVTAGCAVGLLWLSTPVVFAADLEHGRRVFQACASCHMIDSDRSAFGPSLKGIVGRPAAAAADYNYSTAMKAAGASGVVWDEQSLAEFLASPQTKVPGTKMRFWGISDPKQVADLLAYLRSVQ